MSRVFPECTEPTLKIHKRGHYSPTEGDKSSFSMSGHVTYSPSDTVVTSATSVSWILWDLLRICFEQVSEFSACMVESLKVSIEFLFLGLLQSLYFIPA